MELMELGEITPEPVDWAEDEEEAPFRCGCATCRRLRTGHRAPKGRGDGSGDARLD